MKRTILHITVFIISLTSLSAQDIITKKDGTEIESKIIEIGTNEVKYKKHSNLEGPIYSVAKNELIFIKYQNGEKEVFTANSTTAEENKKLSVTGGFKTKYYQGSERISKKEFKRVLATNEIAYNQYKNFKICGLIGKLIYIPGAALLGWGLAPSNQNTAMLIGGGAMVVSGFTLIMTSGSLFRKSLKTYNKGIENNISYSISPNGIGIALNF